ncbi:hypothetical protein [Streptomyces sp. NPDC002644]
MRAVVCAALLAGLSSCSPEGVDRPASSAGTANSAPPETCEKLLGEEGLAWVRDAGAGRTGITIDEPTADAVDRFRRIAKEWRPSADGTLSTLELCRFVRKDQVPHRDAFSIEFGPSISELHQSWIAGEPIDSVENLPVNDDVRLGVLRSKALGDQYVVRVGCRIPGTVEGQETQVPLEGLFRDELLQDTTDEEHLRHLLHAARVMVDEVGCENGPVLPADPPPVPKS